MKVNVWSIVFVSVPGEKPILDLGGKFELTVDEEDVDQLSVMDAFKIFKNAYTKYNIKGKAFVLRYKQQMFFVVKLKDDFKIYTLE